MIVNAPNLEGTRTSCHYTHNAIEASGDLIHQLIMHRTGKRIGGTRFS